ncbi:MAG: GWxTD domain-containing protein [Ignavibacteria bacterium]|nr:GWxTD domain-containing protein [Ignavibacteria bacterium]
MRNSLPLFTIFLLFLITQNIMSKEDSPFYFDAICYKSDNIDTLSRIDVFVVIPYSSLSFFKENSKYIAEFNIRFTLKDSNDKIINNKSITKKLIEKEHLETLGFSAKIYELYHNFEVPEGKYTIEVSIYDNHSNSTYTKRRNTNTLNFSRYDFALSGIMFLSDIEESNGEFKITPFLSDNLGNIDNVFFFVETYQKSTIYDKVDLVYQILDFKRKEVYRSQRYSFNINKKEQIYVPLEKNNLKNGSYFLKIYALKPKLARDSIFKEEEILSVSERTFEISPSITNQVLANIEKSIRQLKYVAYQSDIDYINQASTNEEKVRRFLEFWKKLDPTPSTEYNEAFEEYYERIYYANERFKSYVEGWQTDRGMVYVVLGPPVTIQNQTDFNFNRNYEVWNYSTRTFIFVDYSGFGDFRLYSPPTFSEKYSYKP